MTLGWGPASWKSFSRTSESVLRVDLRHIGELSGGGVFPWMLLWLLLVGVLAALISTCDLPATWRTFSDPWRRAERRVLSFVFKMKKPSFMEA